MRSLLPLLLVSLLFAAQTAEAQQVPVRSITVSGEATIRTAPDKADLSITLFREGKKAAEAKAQVDRLLDTLREIAADAKIAEKDLRTQYTSIQPQYHYPANAKPVLSGYVAQHSIVVTVRDLEKLGDLMQTMVERGIDRVDNVNYGLLKEDALKEDALIQALAIARRKAERLAKASGGEAGQALTIQESGAYVQPPQPMPMMMRAEMAGSSMDKVAAPPAGEVEIRSSVTASYLLK
jgi:uncharacterized protein YggE